MSEEIANGKRTRTEDDDATGGADDRPAKVTKSEESTENVVGSGTQAQSGENGDKVPGPGQPESNTPAAVPPPAETQAAVAAPVAGGADALQTAAAPTAPPAVQPAAPAVVPPVPPAAPQVAPPAAAPVALAAPSAPVPPQAPPVPAQAPAPVPPAPAGVPIGVPPMTAQATVTNPTSIVEERGEVSALYVGRVIGKGGEMIRDLQARSGCRIDVDQSVPPGQPRVITYRGTRKTVDFAKQLVSMLCAENVSEADLPLGEAKRELLVIPATSVGKIIGRGGEMIRELQSRSHAKIQVDHNGTNGLPPTQKRLTVTGTEQSVTKAKEMINFLVANPLMDAMQALNMLVEDKLNRGGTWGSGPPYPNLPNQGSNMQPHSGGYGGYGDHGGYSAPMYQQHQSYPQSGSGGHETDIFYATKNFMGRIIGQKGVTINDLQRRSGCDIQINQDVPPGQDCEISIRGPRQGIEMAKQMLREIIEIGPNHPYAGGAQHNNNDNQYGQYGQQYSPYGYQQQQQQPDPYGQGAYGQSMPNAPNAPYQPGMPYGQAPPPNTYGQQGVYGQPMYNQPPPTGYQMPQQQQQPPYQQYGGQQQQQPQQQQQQQPPQQQQQPIPAAPMPAVSSWKAASAPDGQVYYYNEKTGETQWEKPAGMP